MLRLSTVNEAGEKQVSVFKLNLASALTVDNAVESLWFRVRFSDAEAKKEAFRHDVSIGLDERFVDANKVVYKPAVTHIALTTRPTIPGLGPWIQDPNDPLVATKELVYTGDFYQERTNTRFAFNQKYLDKIINSSDLMLSNLVRIPLQIGHEGDGNGRGEILKLFKAKRYHENKIQASSFFEPQQPLNFLALALSLNAAVTEAKDMDTLTLDELIGLLGITVPEGADDAAKTQLVQAEIQAFREWKQSQAANDNGGGEGGGDETELSAQNQGQQNQPGRLADALNPRKVAMTVSLSAVKQQQNANSAMLDAYVSSGQITPAQKQLLLDNYNAQNVVSLSLSANEAKSPLQKGLELLLSQKQGWKPNGRTDVTDRAAQLALSANGQNANQPVSPLLAVRESK